MAVNFLDGITVDGDVGIGTASPATKLHVSNGDIRIDNSKRLEFGSGGVRINNDASGRMYQKAPLDIILSIYCNNYILGMFFFKLILR